LGLTAGLVPPRVDAPVKAGLLELAAHAHEQAGWSLRRSAGVLGIEHNRLLRWSTRAAAGCLLRIVGVEDGVDGEEPSEGGLVFAGNNRPHRSYP
jgi:hypothetical protein